MHFDRPLETLCLFLDVDGSLIDIAPRPDEVVVPASLLRDLERVNDRVDGALALVSGRSIAELDRLFAPARFRASGVHGAEMRFGPDEPTSVSADDIIPAEVWNELEALLARYPGTFAENKRFSFAVHYRAAPTVALPLTADLRQLVERHPGAKLRLMPGHFVVELKRATFDKGAAIKRFLARPPFRGRIPVFIGDDVTDLPGFAAAVDAGGLALGVGSQLLGTTGTFSNPSQVRQWVAQIAETESLHA